MNKIVSLAKYFTCLKEYLVQHKKQVTDIIALFIAVFTVIDAFYGAPVGQLLIKVCIAVLSWYSGRYGEKVE